MLYHEPKNRKGQPARHGVGVSTREVGCWLLVTALVAGMGTFAVAGTLRFDFESGDLQGWEVVAGSFHQPVRRHPPAGSKPGGRHFLTTNGASGELDGGPNQFAGGGIIESPVFVIRGGEATFRASGMGGRLSSITLHEDDGKVLRELRPSLRTGFRPERWNLDDLGGRRVFLRVTDGSVNAHAFAALDDFVVEGEVDEAATTRRRARLRREHGVTMEPARTALREGGDIIFAVRQPGRNGHYYVNFGRWCSNPGQWEYGSGGRLCRLDPRTGSITVLLDDPRGAVRDPQVHYDGGKILFSYRPGGTHRFHLHEINADGTGLRRLTGGDFDDIEPTYLPDDRIVFCSTRCNRIINCNLVQAAILYACDADGTGIRPLSSNNETENTPWPLPDGRVLFTRWEYVDRSIGPFKALWTMNPDGSGVRTYFGNMNPGHYIDAKPIPGSDEVVVIKSSHMGREHIGTLGVLDARQGPDHTPSFRHLGWEGDLRDPYPLGRDGFLVAREGKLLLASRDGTTETIHELPEEDRAANRWIHEPRLLQKRPREPMVPSRIDLHQPSGQLIMANVNLGRKMEGVSPGDIKRLLVLEVLPKPVNFSGRSDPVGFDHTFNMFRLLGTVPVENDGSAWVEAPAMRSLCFVALDKDGRAIKKMESFVTLQPGEVTSCVGCHEPRTRTVIPPGGELLALRGGPHEIEPVAGAPQVFDFPRDIQPILDRHCLDCHDYEPTARGGPRAGGIILGGDHGPVFSHGYAALHMNDLVVTDREGHGNMPPRTLGSGGSPLMDYLDGSHFGVRLEDRENTMMRLWMDVTAPYAGTYAASGTGTLRGPVRGWTAGTLASEVIERRCASCHVGERRLPVDPMDEVGQEGYTIVKETAPRRMSHHVVFNLSRPDKSLLLLAPLARRQGGYGICRTEDGDAPVFADRSDRDYETLLGMIRSAKARLDTAPRFDTPGFQPNQHYVREMTRMGVLKSKAGNGGVDVYATDEAYWQSLWWSPEPAPGLGTTK